MYYILLNYIYIILYDVCEEFIHIHCECIHAHW